MTLVSRLVAGLRGCLGAGVGIAGSRIAESWPLWPGEDVAVARAIPARRAEFSTGRACARAAMRDLGAPEAAIPMGPDRAPIWPEALNGSISHGAGLCLALVAERVGCSGLGIDIEPDAPLPPEVAEEALGPCAATVAPGSGRVVFCAKEAVYKAFYPMTRQVWGFDAVRIALTDRGFEARLLLPPPQWAGARVVAGHVLRQDGVIVTALALPALK